MDSFINKLSVALQQPLPGIEAQYKMAHSIRQNDMVPTDTVKTACVLALLYPKNNEWHIVLIERMSNNKNDKHSGQISFPGGRYEKADGTLLNGALREAEEEVGIDRTMVTPIGALTNLYIPVSNFMVHPFIGFTNDTPKFIAQPTEVKSILEVPFSSFQNPENVKLKDLKLTQNILLKRVPYFDIQNHVVWGATAMIMSELLEIVKNS